MDGGCAHSSSRTQPEPATLCPGQSHRLTTGVARRLRGLPAFASVCCVCS